MTTDPNTSMPITMDDSKKVDTRPPSDLPSLISSALALHINHLVETKFQAMVENRRTLALMDQALETMIDQKIEAAVTVAIDRHEDNEAHNTQEDIEQMAADQARETLREYAERQEGWVTKDQVNDLITEHVDEELDRIDWEEKVKDVIRDML